MDSANGRCRSGRKVATEVCGGRVDLSMKIPLGRVIFSLFSSLIPPFLRSRLFLCTLHPVLCSLVMLLLRHFRTSRSILYLFYQHFLRSIYRFANYSERGRRRYIFMYEALWSWFWFQFWWWYSRRGWKTPFTREQLCQNGRVRVLFLCSSHCESVLYIYTNTNTNPNPNTNTKTWTKLEPGASTKNRGPHRSE